MKPSEFTNIREGVWDSIKHQFAKSGALGASAQRLAFGKEVEREKSQATKDFQNEKLTQFLTDLPIALAKGFRSGLIIDNTSESVFSSMNYNGFNKLIENVLNEAGTMTKDQFINRYIKNIAAKLNIKISPDIQQVIDSNIADLATQFAYNPSVPPERHKLSEPAKQSAIKVFNTMIQAGELGEPDEAPAMRSPAQSTQTTSQPVPPSTSTPTTSGSSGQRAFGQMAQQLGQQGKATPTRTGGKVAGQVSQTPNAIRKREQRSAAKNTPGKAAFGNMINSINR